MLDNFLVSKYRGVAVRLSRQQARHGFDRTSIRSAETSSFVESVVGCG